jgi:predicted  nucleic acid-binding Zn-ribbon protein
MAVEPTDEMKRAEAECEAADSEWKFAQEQHRLTMELMANAQARMEQAREQRTRVFAQRFETLKVETYGRNPMPGTLPEIKSE